MDISCQAYSVAYPNHFHHYESSHFKPLTHTVCNYYLGILLGSDERGTPVYGTTYFCWSQMSYRGIIIVPGRILDELVQVRAIQIQGLFADRNISDNGDVRTGNIRHEIRYRR